ncbi:class II aldolase/adducin family protein [Candidatus Margulisiibacteriota bacterium]
MLEEFKRIGRFMFQEGLIDSHGGNMSVRQGDKIFITHRDAMLGDLSEKDIIEVGMNAGPDDKQASREIEVHRAVYKQNGAQAIIHAHPANAIAISITDNKIVPQDAEGLALFKAASIVRVRDSIGSSETVRLLPSFLTKESSIAVVKGHGSFATGKTLAEAYKLTSCLENSCKVLVAVRASGSSRQTPTRDRGRVGHHQPRGKSAIPPGIGVMDRSRDRNRDRKR